MNIQTPPDTAFETVSVEPRFDDGPGKHRIGLIIMATDYVTERDFINMRPSDDVTYFVARIPASSDNNPDTLTAMEPHLGNTAALILPEARLDAIAYSCTAASAILGQERVEKAIQGGRPGVACATPVQAAMDGLNMFGAKRIAVLTPYQDSVNAAVANRLSINGFDIVRYLAFKFTNDTLMARLDPASIEEAAIEADCPEAEALFISCTAIRGCEIVDRLEQKLGKPVITAVQALFWMALRQSGYKAAVPSYGRLLREF